MAGAGSRENHSFKRHELAEIGRGNAALLSRLAAVATRRPEVSAPALARLPESSAQRNRRKAAAEIEKANLRLLSKLQSTRSTISGLQGKPAPPPGGSSARRPGGGAGGGAPLGARPEWCDPQSQQRPGADAWRREALPHKGAEAAAGGARLLFKSRDLRDIAMQASSDKHTL